MDIVFSGCLLNVVWPRILLFNRLANFHFNSAIVSLCIFDCQVLWQDDEDRKNT